MRIAVNTRMLLRDRLEGIGWYSYEILQRLVQDHPNDHFIFFFDRPWDPDFVFGPNVTPVKVSPPARHPLLFWIWFELRLPALLRRHRADVFFSPDGFLSLRSPVPTLLTVHDLAYKHFPGHVTALQRAYYRHFMPRFMHRADHILAVSEATRLDILDSGISAHRVSVAHNGANPRFLPAAEADCRTLKAEITGGRPFFLYVGAIHPRKNVARLVRAWTLFRAQSGQPHCLVLLGRMAWMADDVREAIGSSPFRDDILAVGYQGDRLPLFYSAAEALVYVSRFEGFGIPILEAMCCETAVITSDVSSMPEVAGNAALLVDPTDTSAIAAAMQRLAADPLLREDLIRAGRHQRQKFSWDQAAAKVWTHLRRMTDDRRPRTGRRDDRRRTTDDRTTG
jgi:glycosyltransferase involved in cell wall biosynthesis